MSNLDPLRAQVERLKAVKPSVKAALLGLVAQYEACKNDPAEIQALTDETRSEIDGIVSDVAAHTPAATEPAPPPGPEMPPGGEVPPAPMP